MLRRPRNIIKLILPNVFLYVVVTEVTTEVPEEIQSTVHTTEYKPTFTEVYETTRVSSDTQIYSVACQGNYTTYNLHSTLKHNLLTLFINIRQVQ